VDRPLIGAALELPESNAAFHLPAGHVRPTDLELASYLKTCDHIADVAQSIPGDSIWAAAPFQGMPWMEAICGCEVHCTGDSLWAERVESEPEESLVRWRESPWLDLLLEATHGLAAHADARYPVGPPVLRGPADVVSAMRGPNVFCMDFYDRRKSLLRWLEIATDACVAVIREVLALLGPFDTGCVQASRQVWAPGACAETQEDAAALLSPSHYQQFILSLDRQIWENVPYVSFHLHSASLQHLDFLLTEPGLPAIEITADVAGPPPAVLIQKAARVQGAGKSVILHGTFSAQDIAELMAGLSPAGLYIAARVKSVHQAVQDLGTLLPGLAIEAVAATAPSCMGQARSWDCERQHQRRS